MLTEFLKHHPMAGLLKDGTRTLYPPAEKRKAWDAVPGEYRDQIAGMAEEYAKIPYPSRAAAGFLAFARTGDRQADEKPYFTRRRKLCAAVLNACLDPDAETDDITDGIWMICEESTWVISAHNVNPIPGAPQPAQYPLPDIRKPYIDLFSAQTGMILSLTGLLLGKRLDAVSPMIRQRIREEIRRRILRPFMRTDDFWWMGFRRKDLNNWTPWILSNVMVCAALDPMPAGRLAKLLTRACGMLDRYLEVLPADGGCDEGAGYWNMAGGALLDCLTILEKLTGGKMTFWQEEKIRNLLRYPMQVELTNGWFANFADCDARPFISGERMETAGQRIGEPALEALGTRMRGTVADQLNDVPHLTRALVLVLHAPAGKTERIPEQPGDVWLPDLQVRLVRRGGWILACKGGHNGENHNHNDVGSFMLYIDQEPAVVDAGNMTYTAKTFSSERYTLWNTRSAFHNLPLIGGLEQQPGEKYRATKVNPGESGVAMNLEEAWPAEAGLRSFRRALSLSDCGLILKDDIQLEAEKDVAWVFLLRHQPVPESGAVTAGPLRMTFPSSLAFSTEEIPVTDPRMARNFPGSLWRVVLTAPAAKAHAAEFRFSAQ